MDEKLNDLDNNPRLLRLLSSINIHTSRIKHHVERQGRGYCLDDSKPTCKNLISKINSKLSEISKIIEKAKEY